MARLARTVVVNVPQHLTQCGEGRQSLPRARRKAGNFPSVPGFPTNRIATRSSSGTRKAVLLLAFGACVFASSCRSSETIWSVEATSPDGNVVAKASAVTRNTSLSIISGTDTNVYLNWVGDQRPPTLVLSLADGSDHPVDTNLELKWLTPTHLELTYKGNQTVNFQATKWANIDISVRDLASEKTQDGAADSGNGTRNLQAPAPPPLAYQKTSAPTRDH
jgi:hypothetical protein